ncbi:MAG: S41 family peptidase [Candidatus Buchananbacteria bacterium]
MEIFISWFKQIKSKLSQRIISGYLLAGLLILVFIFGVALGQLQLRQQIEAKQKDGTVKNMEEKPPEFLSKDVDFKQFWQIWQYVKSNYVKSDISDTQLFYGALEGMVASLGDPYTVFFNPDISKKFDEELSGSFEGIGAEIGRKNDQITVIAPLPGTPAEKAGLKAGDIILAIDGKETSTMSLDYAVSIIRGNKGTKVKLSVYTPDNGGTAKDLEITREKIEIDSVRVTKKIDGQEKTDKNDTQDNLMLPGNIAHVELLYFNENTLADWDQTVLKVLANNPKGIILDLRNNPGGFLTTAIQISGEWLDGKVVVSERLRSGEKTDHYANRQARLAGIPTVVLINGGSASGSEIVAGALQDYGVAKLVGEKSFGKGSVQDLKEFSDGSSVKLTIAEWLTPNGKNINKEGIKPDVEVKLTKEDYDAGKDPQLDKALEILAQ